MDENAQRISVYGALILVDLVTFWRIDLNVRTFQELDFRLITASKYNLCENHISRPRLLLWPIILSCWNIIQEMLAVIMTIHELVNT